jgi:hypothetical protein
MTILSTLIGLAVLAGAVSGPAAHAAHLGGATVEAAAADTAIARAFYERFKALSGRWAGRSTRGWEERITFQVVAGGSAVMETSFDAHPNETMVTLFSLDLGRLALTHYCVAGNQPHLQATRFSPERGEVTFTFRDGGNLVSRDRGHMDQAMFRFLDGGRMTSRWTWYQDGAERWMEEIEYRRLP